MTTRFDGTIREINSHARRSHVGGLNFCVDCNISNFSGLGFCFHFLNNSKFRSRNSRGISSRRSVVTTRNSVAQYFFEFRERSPTQLCGNLLRYLVPRSRRDRRARRSRRGSRRGSRRSFVRNIYGHYFLQLREPSLTQFYGKRFLHLLAHCSSFVCLDTYMKRRVSVSLHRYRYTISV